MRTDFDDGDALNGPVKAWHDGAAINRARRRRRAATIANRAVSVCHQLPGREKGEKKRLPARADTISLVAFGWVTNR